MQKKLRALLPKDYASDYRRYRPSSHQNARRRLFHVKCCTNDRVKKYRELRSQVRVASKDEACSKVADSGSDPPERRASAFRNNSCSSLPNPSDYISMAWLDLPNIQLGMENPPDYYAVEYTQRIHKLRREATLGTTSHLAETRCLPAAPSTMPIKSSEDLTISINDDKQMGESEYQLVRRHGFSPRIDTTSTNGHEAETWSESLSIRSIGRRLVKRYSQSTIEHIASILRSSSTSSRRSSLLSLVSFASSKLSSKISLD